MFRLSAGCVIGICNGSLEKLDYSSLIKKTFQLISRFDVVTNIERYKTALEHSRKLSNQNEKNYQKFRDVFYTLQQLGWKNSLFTTVERFLEDNRASLPNFKLFKQQYLSIVENNLFLLFYLKDGNPEYLEQEILFMVKHLIFYVPVDSRDQSFGNYYLALRLFYSDETKHLFSKELTVKIAEYQKKIKELVHNDNWKKHMFVEEPGKFFRFRTSASMITFDEEDNDI